MSKNVAIIRGVSSKPVASDALAAYFERTEAISGQLFIGYPIIGSADGAASIDALLVSPELGLVVFDLVEGSDIGDAPTRQDESATRLEAKLKLNRDLVRRRSLLVPISAVTFSPAAPSSSLSIGEYPVANADSMDAAIDGIEWTEFDQQIYDRTVSALQSISTIRRARSPRSVTDPKSRGSRLKSLEESIATLDNLQSKAVIETVEGVQRIRGLAGSGKSIVLALKAAYLHAQNPDWRIAVTFNTRSLKGHFRRLINGFCIEQTGQEPDWTLIRVVNAWGAAGGAERQGIYHQFCMTNGVEYLDFGAARDKFGTDDAFDMVCQSAVASTPNPEVMYDAILVDEAQDFPSSFLRLCYESLDEQKRLVYAYDELQTLNGSGVPSPIEIFGTHENGQPRVTFDQTTYDRGARRDIMLDRCYRNSRPVLVTAHSMGFGVYRQPPSQGKTGLVQMFDSPDLWLDIGYQLRSGELRPGNHVSLARTYETSPKFLEEHSTIDDLIEFRSFPTERAQNEWIANQIQINLASDELRYDDIVVINTNPATARTKVGPIRRLLFEAGIQSHLAGVDTQPDVFFRPDEDSITFSGIYRAKGNEAGMVYITNAHDSFKNPVNLARARNRLFTAITRSKAWVRIVGVGHDMDLLIAEYERLKAAKFELNFRYPTDKERAELQIVHRDVSLSEQRAVKKQRASLRSLVDEIEGGRVYIEDLDAETLARFRALLQESDDTN